MGTPTAGVSPAPMRDSRAEAMAARGGRARRLMLRRIGLFAAAGASAIVIALLFAAVAERLAAGTHVLSNVRVDNIAVGGKSEAAVTRQFATLADRLDDRPINARAGTTRLVASPSNVAFHVDAAATARAARNAGRTHNPFAAVADTILRRFRPDRVAMVVSYDRAGVEGLLDGWSKQIDHGLVEGDLRFNGTQVVEAQPHAGMGIVRDAARHVIQRGLANPTRGVLVLPTGRVAPQLDAAAVARTATLARRVLSAPVVITAGDARALLTPAQVALTLTTTVDHHHLALVVDRDRLQRALGAQAAKLTVPAVDASFAVAPSGAVSVVPSRTGHGTDLDAVGRAIARGEHDVRAPVRTLATRHDTAWAQRLGIKELVSSFTTYYPSGESRVTNIHRGADLINNRVVAPGAVFSLNDALGPRTPERGFVRAPVFYGEFTEDYGGGVSQLATTVFNAVFFGGYVDVAHQPHSIYISRYPMGRESTINYGTIDVKFRNDSHHGVLIRASYSASSVTVSFYGDKEGRVVTAEGPHVLAQQPPTNKYIAWPLLPKGKQQVHQSGYTGYDVENFRIIRQPGKTEIRQRFFWHYDMIPNQILVGTGPAPTPPSTPPPAKPGTPATTSTTKPATSTTKGH